ncbi:hypothetical protein [Blattabacterium cuenoti]|uniref:hypothetical protein n=1 Tax=Blattabacterium cuenoti TaxID=1653831 RepID=UPI001EE9BD4F|nr:hypothetical protein [Blattabacterium cuenoti]
MKLISWCMILALSIFNDCMYSLVNIIIIISGVIALISILLLILLYSSLPNKDYNHPYGGHKIEFISTAIKVLITAFVNYFLGFLFCKIVKKNKYLILIASGKHLQIDTYSVLLL